ncbi:GNAT family N-acetyltransferase [Lachnoclostridium sp. An169]|uniref:GNAT family N-acetyltransferase n=1 Tax=Lachnoclostridium sp. An169 TaxID=1965569 RepID=UPI000B3A4116|nr:GNAT family N-acetyltransferase [Lachnoclostridium sp. An169]OUP79671.1 GNAT family N-acetyltransferase [Lachnoclostridium sp. An169]
MVREAAENDLNGLLHLYKQLHNSKVTINLDELLKLWSQIVQDNNHHVIVVEEDGKIVSSCVCVIIPNLTHNQQPYALIENVITDEAYRKKGLATKCLDYAKEIAIKKKCYKIMLLTGSKKNATFQFYRNAGYNSEDKTAFIQWI